FKNVTEMFNALLTCGRCRLWRNRERDMTNDRNVFLFSFVDNRKVGVTWQAIIDFDAIGASAHQLINYCATFSSSCNNHYWSMCSWIRSIHNRSTSNNTWTKKGP